ncbi:hypothetical protein NM688_g3104 [Phlebia brevispora]|uniref:Uncharacterized protein n=1 Tax=Phlebia brevispora TaxID=194682 RepID=A0ACC1T6G6_9APHY|nr:hypothetical protein NM688_g3104 [Phlebia brevispora]
MSDDAATDAYLMWVAFKYTLIGYGALTPCQVTLRLDEYLLALVAYEYFITFQDEVNIIWRSKWTAGKALFLITRYLMIIVSVITFLMPTPTYARYVASPPSIVLQQVFTQSLVLSFAAFSALRVYALRDRSWAVALLVMLCNTIPVVINVYFSVTGEPVFIPVKSITPQCGINLTPSVEAIFIRKPMETSAGLQNLIPL